jgi:acyl dehydratase
MESDAATSLRAHDTAVWYLDDLTIGQVFSSRAFKLDAASIKSFAAAFDPQPFHLDDEAAEATIFNGLAASGWHTAAITMRLLVECAGKLAGGLIGAGAEIAWPAPARPGDTLDLRAEVVAIDPSRSKPDRGIVTLRSETLNQNGQAVQRMTAKLLVFRRPAATP